MLALVAHALAAAPNCTALASCGACAANDACGWCTAGAVCMERRREASCHGCLRTSEDACGPSPGCASRTDCAACGASSACVWYTQSQRCLDALVDPRSGSVAACNPADQQKEKGCAISVLDYKERCVLEPPAARCKDFHNCSACANASAAGCMWFTEGAAGGSGACVEANESTPGVWETCNADDAPLTHGCNRTVQTYRTRCPLDAAKPFCANYTRACDCMKATCLLYTSPSPRDRG